MPEHTEIIRVRFVDTDASQRIHYTSIFRHFETAEHELMRALGVPYKELEDGPFVYPRVNITCDYRAPMLYDDHLAVTARVARVGTTSFSFAFSVRRMMDGQAGEEETARGTITVVCVERATGKAHPIAERLRAALAGD